MSNRCDPARSRGNFRSSARPPATLIPVRTRVGLIAVVVASGCLLVPATGGAQSRLPGPDLPGTSSPSLRTGVQASGGYSRSKLARKLGSLARKAPGASGFYVYDVGAKGKNVLFDHDEGKRRKLASNTKLFTTSTALQRLGGGKARIETVVRRKGRTERGMLRGNLYLVGGGDPSFGAGGVRELAREVKGAGIRKVKGDLVADDTIFDRVRGVPDSNWGPSPYVAPLSGLVYGGSTYDGDPAKEAARAFEKKLRKRGVRVEGKVRVGDTPKKVAGTDPIAVYESPTIAALIQATNFPSNNFFAEMLLKGIAAQNGKGTTRRGVRAVETFARQHGSKVAAKDGSGLTANNRSSPRDVVRLLVAMRKESDAKAFYASLPRAGKEGTLDDRMEGTSAAKRCRGKTGTITGVSVLSGYCKAGHDLVAYSLLMNGVTNLEAAHDVQDKMVVSISKYQP